MMHRGDGDYRKLMFAIGLLMCIPLYAVAIVGLDTSVVTRQIFEWTALPMLLAFIFTLLNERVEIHPKLYLTIFISATALTFVSFIVPDYFSSVPFMAFGVAFASILAVYRYARKFDPASVLLFLSMPGFSICFLAILFDQIPLAIFAALSAKVSVILAFEVAKRQENVSSGLLTLQKQLNTAEENFSKLLNILPDAAVIIDGKGKILALTSNVPKLTGYPEHELIGRNFLTIGFVTDESKALIETNLAKRMKGQHIEPYTVMILHKNRDLLQFEINAAKIEFGDKEADLVVLRDLTERNKMAERLLKSERLAAIGELATMVAHDLRNPLQGIAAGVHYVKKSYSDKSNEKMASVIQCMENSVHYSDKIIKDLLDYSLNVKLDLSEADPHSVVKEALSQITIPESIAVVEQFETNPKIVVDIQKIKRAVINILTNAVDAMPSGGTLTLLSKQTPDNLELSVADTGVGIPKEKMDKLWTPFMTTKAKGLGLGLPIAKRFVEEHGGTITVKTQPNEGTTFTLSIPIAQPKKTEITV